MTRKLRTASTRSKEFAAILGGQLRYEARIDAEEKLDSICTRFETSKKQRSDNGDPVFWIRGLEVTPQEEKLGYRGNFAVIFIEERTGLFWLSARRLTVPLEQHPVIGRPKIEVPEIETPKRGHPNWGHPLLRKIKKGATFPSIDNAFEQLRALYLEYERVIIPAPDRYYAIVYSKQYGKNPTRRFIFCPVEKDGVVTIDFYENPNQSSMSRKRADITIDRLLLTFDDFAPPKASLAPERTAGIPDETRQFPNRDLKRTEDTTEMVVVDQHWLRKQRVRIDFSIAKREEQRRHVLACPDSSSLKGFRSAATHYGWILLDTPPRPSDRLQSIGDYLRGNANHLVTVVTGDPVLISYFHKEGIEVRVVRDLVS